MIATACSTGSPWPFWTARLTDCTAVGELSAILFAIARTASISSARGCTSLTMPNRYASWAVIGSPVISICIARPGGSRRGKNTGDPAPADNPTIASVAQAHRKTPAQALIRWSIQLGNVVIPRSASPERIKENLDVFDFELTDDEMATLNGLNDGTRFRPNPETYTGT